MLPEDLDLTEELIRIKKEYGFPRAFESSWAKNKSAVFHEIVRKTKEAELRRPRRECRGRDRQDRREAHRLGEPYARTELAQTLIWYSGAQEYQGGR